MTTTKTRSDSDETKVSETEKSDVESHDEDRQKWGSPIESILTCVGVAVGLGNIWRFPAIAYGNGGGAFLIPYICCSIFVGLPLVYCELYIGQWAQTGPPLALRRFAPAFEGVGWMAICAVVLIGIFYMVVIGWTSVYLGYIIGGQSYRISTCDNWWNDDLCIDSAKSDLCREQNATTPVALNGTCYSYAELNATGLKSVVRAASEQFFVNFVTTRSSGISDFQGMNWPMFGSLLIMWALTYLVVCKGVKIMGKLAYVISTTPYLLIIVLLVRGVTLENSREGLDRYLLNPDFSLILSLKTWSEALTQLIFSLSVGYGCLITLTSFNRRNNNCFRDACIIILFDTVMSSVGGAAVYAALGYLTFATGKSFDDIVMGGPSLVFIVYPEALSKMPIPWLWQFVFFLTIFFLGFSSIVSVVQTPTATLIDNVPRFKGKEWLVSMVFAAFSFTAGIVFVTKAGWYWFNIFADFTTATLPIIITLFEAILLVFVYGYRNRTQDCQEIFGKPTIFSKIIGRHSPIWRIGLIWCIVVMLPVLYFTCDHSGLWKGDISLPNGKPYIYPIWAVVLGWVICLFPLVCIPWYFFLNYKEIVLEKKLSIKWLFRPHPGHASFERIYGQPDYPSADD